MRNKMLGLVLMCLLTTSFAAAQASRTWVSGVGDDANPCSRTAPCKTFAGAISKTAAGGEIDALDPGGFGAVTITKAITIDGGGGQVASVLGAGTNAIVVAAGSGDLVILRNLRLQGIQSGLSGIVYQGGRTLVVENCDIMNFTSNGIWQQTGHMSVRNTTVTNSNLGISVTGGTATIEDTNLSANVDGLRVGAALATAARTVATHNSTGGFAVAGGGVLSLADSTAANNGTGVLVVGVAELSNVIITGNTIGISFSGGGQVVSWGNNHIAANGTNGAPSVTIAPQ
jgi:hypothetical protein